MQVRGYTKGEEQCQVRDLPKQNLSLTDTGGSTNSMAYLAETSPQPQTYHANSPKEKKVTLAVYERKEKQMQNDNI